MSPGTLSTTFSDTAMPAAPQRSSETADHLLQKLREDVYDLALASMAYKRYLNDCDARMGKLSGTLGCMADIRAIELLEWQYRHLSTINIPPERFGSLFKIIDRIKPAAPVAALNCRIAVHDWRNAIFNTVDEADRFLNWQKNLLLDDTGTTLESFLKQNDQRMRKLACESDQIGFAVLQFELQMLTLRGNLAENGRARAIGRKP